MLVDGDTHSADRGEEGNLCIVEENGGRAAELPIHNSRFKADILVHNPNVRFTRVHLNDKAILKGFRVRKWARQFVHDIVNDVLCDDDDVSAQGTDEPEIAAQEDTQRLQQELSAMGTDLPVSFAGSKRLPESRSNQRKRQRTAPRWPTVGCHCKCLYSEDSEYYLVQVLSLSQSASHVVTEESQATVEYLGYSQQCTVPTSWLQPLEESVDTTASGSKHIRFEDSDECTPAVTDHSAADTNGVTPLRKKIIAHHKALAAPFDTAATSDSAHCGADSRGQLAFSGPLPHPTSKHKYQRQSKDMAIFPANGLDEPAPANVPMKYWQQRFRLFSQFDLGCRLDAEGWFSVTPERIATHIAERSRTDLLVDLMVGCGGNAVQFAESCHQVIAIDLDPQKIACARHNARIYGVADRIDFIVGDAIVILPNLPQPDIIFLSPPWGGPCYASEPTWSLSRILCSVDGKTLLQECFKVCPNVCALLPRNVDLRELAALSGGRSCEIEENVLNYKTKTITVYFGDYFLKVAGDGKTKAAMHKVARKRRRKEKAQQSSIPQSNQQT